MFIYLKPCYILQMVQYCQNWLKTRSIYFALFRTLHPCRFCLVCFVFIKLLLIALNKFDAVGEGTGVIARVQARAEAGLVVTAETGVEVEAEAGRGVGAGAGVIAGAEAGAGAGVRAVAPDIVSPAGLGFLDLI